MHIKDAIDNTTRRLHQLSISHGISTDPSIINEIDVLTTVLEQLNEYNLIYWRGDGYKGGELLINFMKRRGVEPIFDDMLTY